MNRSKRRGVSCEKKLQFVIPFYLTRSPTELVCRCWDNFISSKMLHEQSSLRITVRPSLNSRSLSADVIHTRCRSIAFKGGRFCNLPVLTKSRWCIYGLALSVDENGGPITRTIRARSLRIWHDEDSSENSVSTETSLAIRLPDDI